MVTRLNTCRHCGRPIRLLPKSQGWVHDNDGERRCAIVLLADPRYADRYTV